jgi:phage terminase large subunit-like protein
MATGRRPSSKPNKPAAKPLPEDKNGFKLTPKQEEATRLAAGPQRHTMLEGGARSAKTFTHMRNIILRALRAKESRHCVLRLNSNACTQSVRLDTFAKCMRLCFPDVRFKEHMQDGYNVFPNGSEIWFAGLDDKERVDKILGKEFATMFFNECSQIPYASVLVARTRLAQKIKGLVNRAYYDQNPTSTKHWTNREFKEGLNPISRAPMTEEEKAQFRWMQMNPVDNIDNIDPLFVQSLQSMPERYKMRFLKGLPITDLDGALWTAEILELCRLPEASRQLDYDRIVVAVDPSGASGEEDVRSDEIGISIVGRRKDYAHVLGDATLKGSPEQWGREVVNQFRRWQADCVVGEGNFGGDMVRATIHAVDPNIPYRKVTATRGKVVRAEPVSALFETGKAFLVGSFPKLEDELLNFTSNGYKGDRSPNRADAMIWAAHDLMFAETDDGLLQFYEEMARQMGFAIKPESGLLVPSQATLQ